MQQLRFSVESLVFLTISIYRIAESLTSVELLVFFLFFSNYFWVALGLHCFAEAFSSCGEQGLLSLAAVRGLLIAAASLVAEHGL